MGVQCKMCSYCWPAHHAEGRTMPGTMLRRNGCAAEDVFMHVSRAALCPPLIQSVCFNIQWRVCSCSCTVCCSCEGAQTLLLFVHRMLQLGDGGEGANSGFTGRVVRSVTAIERHQHTKKGQSSLTSPATNSGFTRRVVRRAAAGVDAPHKPSPTRLASIQH